MRRENWRKSARRNEPAIHAYIGPNGSGKTAAMVHDAMAAMLEGRPQLSTVPLLDWTAICDGCGSVPCVPECVRPIRPPHPLWVPFTSLEQLLDWRDGDIDMDEVQGVASAAEHHGLPYQVANRLRKLRHGDTRLRWTAPDWMAANAVIRRVTRAVTVAEGKAGKKHVLPCPGCNVKHSRPVRGGCQLFGRSRLWKDNRALRWETFDGTRFEEFNVNHAKADAKTQKRLKLRPMVRQTYWRPGGLVERAYDTYGEVIELGAADMAGVCIICGGTRRRKQCQGHGEDDQPLALVKPREFRALEAVDSD